MPAYNNNLHKIFAYIKIFAPMKYSRPWNIRAHEIFAPMKYLRPWKYLHPCEISALRQGCSCLIIYDSNKAAVEISAAGNVGVQTLTIWARQNLHSVSFSVRLKSSLSEGVASPPCSPQVESALRPAQLIWAESLPYCTGLLYRHELPKCSRPSNVGGRRYFDPLFGEKSKT